MTEILIGIVIGAILGSVILLVALVIASLVLAKKVSATEEKDVEETGSKIKTILRKAINKPLDEDLLEDQESLLSDEELLGDAEFALKELAEAVKDLELIGSIKSRFKDADELVHEQLDLMGALDAPSSGASHSKHKGELITRIKQIEAEKLAIYKTILADGINPTLTAVIDGDATDMKLSDAVHEMESALEKVSPLPQKTDSKKPRENFLKLVKSENVNESENPTIS
jgi:hypothetical protein